ncbi:tRNA pseudouridine(55) synthase TruB [Cohnella sp. CFH 77786]|uniref:tRNA pseudouridine(55) synthase TruB n=1 Tax=Cohnella sp. CFH 77786 TaxID=2662265 RepID=UPI001C60E253|nr:tRNA pseudouridine(55) synthase TruB [Cohnella sp. CFH 77786]MBW5444527.1 tRNA pseudouridine(55) synthase TruB [Cohnella sp. CFH 77786]
MKGTTVAADGVLAVWKPAGWTSHDVVAKARRLLGVRRIGHTGTLDPAVTGVLPLCVGRATRFVEYLQEMPKTYEATLRFGIATDTEDLQGTVTEEADVSHLTEERMKEAVLSFLGEIEQIPPMVSAVKVNGKRLYELARQGIAVERKPRRATIHAIDILNVTAGISRPEIRFSVRCSKGTYIRTLCVDIGRRLGVPAVMASLVRTESAGLRREQCVTLEDIPELVREGTLRDRIVPADRLLTHLPRTSAPMPESLHAVQGKPIRASRLNPVPEGAGLWLVDRPGGGFLGIFELEEDSGWLRAVKVFPPAEHDQDGN